MTPETPEFVVIRRGRGVEMQHGRYKNLYFAKHSHDDYAISVNFNGVESIWLDGRTYTAVPGQITAYNPGEVQSGGSDERDGWEMRALHFDVDWVARVLGEEGTTARGYPILRRAIIDDSHALNLICSLPLNSHPLDPQDPRLVELAGVLFERYGDAKPINLRKSGPRGLYRALEYMQDHLASTVTLSDLSRVSGLSSSYLTRACRTLTGFPPHQFQLQLRAQKARRLLAEGHDIAEVAHGLGFSDQSHLHRLFRRVYGVTPGQYRA